MTNTRSIAVLLAMSGLLLPCALAGDRFPIYWSGPQGEGFWGPGGDVNGDGRMDLIMASPGLFASPASPQQAFIRSGVNGSLLHTWMPSLPNYWALAGQVLAPAGDLDLDGFGDVALPIFPAIGSLLPQVVEVRSGQDGSVMDIIYPPPIPPAPGGIGLGVAGMGDLDGDSLPELFLSGYYQPGCVGLFDFEGPPFVLQYSIIASCGIDTFGRLDDVDGDGLPDFYVGAGEASPGGIGSAGWIGIYSGGSGVLIASLSGTIANDMLGGDLVPLSDVTGDGKPELAATRWSGPDRVEVFSLPTFATLYVLPVPPMAGPNGAILQLEPLGDGDGDGMDDFLVRWRMQPQFNEGITAFSGPTGALLGEFGLNGVGQFLHVSPFGSLGDVNGDGLGDFAASPAGGLCPLCSPQWTIQGLWSPWFWPIISPVPTLYVSRNFDLLGTPTVGGAAQFQVVAPKRAGRPYQVVFAQDFVFPGLPLGPFLFPLVPDALLGASAAAGIGGTLDATGHGTVSVPIPNDPSLHGAVFQASGVVYDLAGPLGIGCVLSQLPVIIP